ncbi:MAG: GNAT family N-acetyltransferase [Spirochaetales bacterium]|nr:GNAT family N-acetyltransferase [Spirochaetales bacterium]
MEIKKINSKDVPYDLLFLADEDDSQIQKYRDDALFWAAREGDEIRGMIGLKEISPQESEIVCVAVYETFQNQQIGTRLVEEAVAWSKQKNYKKVIIKTGNCGIGQLYIYQRCGFRFESINRDYFTKFYPLPIYENSLRCADQIVLSYTIYSETEKTAAIEDYWKRFVHKKPEYKDRTYETWSFCYGEYLPDKLLGLVRTGKKTGTSSALELYEEGEEIPREGDLSIVTYGNGMPGCIIETKEIRIKKYRDISNEEARLEGEGDLSLEYWRKAHEWFFKLEYGNEGKEFSEDIPVIFERFELIYDEDYKNL